MFGWLTDAIRDRKHLAAVRKDMKMIAGQYKKCAARFPAETFKDDSHSLGITGTDWYNGFPPEPYRLFLMDGLHLTRENADLVLLLAVTWHGGPPRDCSALDRVFYNQFAGKPLRFRNVVMAYYVANYHWQGASLPSDKAAGLLRACCSAVPKLL